MSHNMQFPDKAQVIKYEGDNATFIWKHPTEDFNIGTQLIVHESQEAVFFLNGQALDLFGSGRHTLETQNLPFAGKFLKRPIENGQGNPFHCEVYFINKTEQPAIKWGLAERAQYVDPTYGVALEVGCGGELTLCVGDSRKLLVKLVGTEAYLGQEQLINKFKSAFMQVKIKSHLARLMTSGEFNLFDIDSHLEELSEALKVKLLPDFAEYGLSLVNFYVARAVKPEENKDYQAIKQVMRQQLEVIGAKNRQQLEFIQQETESGKKKMDTVMAAQGAAEKRQIEGYTYQDERGFDIAQAAAQNEGAGNFTSAGIGLGMMGGIAGEMGAIVSGVTTNAVGADFKQKVEKLKLLKENGILSDAEFEAEKKNLLANL